MTAEHTEHAAEYYGQETETSEMAAPAITADDRALFDRVTSGDASELLLMSVLFDGAPTSAVCQCWIGPDNDYRIVPVYLTLTDDLRARLGAPDDGRAPETVE